MPIIAAVGAVAGIASGVMAAEAQRKASNTNRDMQRETNELNYKQWQESRGKEGSALFPMYAPAGMEKKGLEDAFEYYNAMGITPPAEMMAKYQAIVDSEQKNIAAGDKLISDIFSGNMEREALAQNAPVEAARLAMAETGREGIEAARGAQEAALSAEEAAKGYIGTGSFAQNRRLASTIPFFQQAAGQVAGANLANAAEVAKIQEAQRQTRIGAINMPLQRAAGKVSLAQLPASALSGYAGIRQAPLNFWKMAYSPPPTNTAYQMPVVESPVGAALGGLASGLGGVAGAVQTDRTNAMVTAGQNQQNAQFNTYMDYLRSRDNPGAYGPGY